MTLLINVMDDHGHYREEVRRDFPSGTDFSSTTLPVPYLVPMWGRVQIAAKNKPQVTFLAAPVCALVLYFERGSEFKIIEPRVDRDAEVKLSAVPA